MCRTDQESGCPSCRPRSSGSRACRCHSTGWGEHQRSGVDQYGPVEPESHSLMVLTNNGSGWDVLIELDKDGPRGTVVVGEHGEIDLEMAQSLTL